MSWVKLQLTRGRADGTEWQVDASAAGARIEVGSDPTCSWVVSAPGVSVKHLEIYWDGEVLWVARIHGADEVKVDGLLVDDWYATAKGSAIQFGQAELKVDTGTGGVDTSGVASRVTERVTNPDAHPEAKTTLAGPGAISGAASLQGDPTAILNSPHQPHISAAATQITGPTGGNEDAAGRIAAFEAQMQGGGAGAGGAGGAGPMPSAQATQLVAMPDVPGTPQGGAPSAARRPPPPRIGQNVSSVQRATPTPVPPAPIPPTQEVPSAAGTPPEPGPGEADSSGGYQVGPDTPFAAPPAYDVKASKKRRKKAANEKAGSLPARTWVLLIATVGALLFVLFMDDEEDAGVPPPPDTTQAAADAATSDAGPTEASDAGATPAAPDTAVAVVAPPDPQTDTGSEQDGEEDDEEASPLVRQAVDALVANRQRDAYDLYGQLAAQDPDEPAYAALRDILRRRIQASCRDGVDLQGNPCEQIE